MSRAAPSRPRVALLIESSRASGREILHGIAEYVRIHTRWSVFWQERSLHDPMPAQLRKWKADGIIARIEGDRLAAQIKQLRLPAVDVLGWHPIPGVPRFGNDRQTVVRLAVDYLRQLGLQQFAYCGLPGVTFSEDRGRHFTEWIRAMGHSPLVYDNHERCVPASIAAAESTQVLRTQRLGRWLKSLPKPVGLMACNDACAQQILSVCRDQEIDVPHEIAVIGVDNDEVLCELSDPALSSVALNNARIGYEAAAMLDRMLAGEKPESEEIRIAPLGVVPRRSTEMLAVDDPDVAAALRFIRNHALDGITVTDVLAHVMLSASTLKRRFVQHVGRSPKAEILRIQLERVKELLATTHLTLREISVLTGFHQVEWLCKVFRRKTGQTPGEYREAMQPTKPSRPSGGDRKGDSRQM